MTSKLERRVDAFTFALGGTGIASSWFPMPVVASDRIAKAWDLHLSGGAAAAPRTEGRSERWLAQCCDAAHSARR